MAIIVSIRESASRGELAWTVVSEPSWPVFIAWSMSSASAPRTSPTTMRSGRIRRLLITRLRWVISPLPSMLAGRVSSRTTWPWLELELGRVLDGDDALRLSGMKLDITLSRVVLPAPVPPEMSTLSRALHDGRRAAPPMSSVRRTVLPPGPWACRRVGAEAADRDRGAVERQGRHDGVDTGAVRQAGVHHGVGLVDAATHRRHDLLDDAHQVGVVLEAHRRPLEATVALDVDVLVAVHQDVGHGWILKQGLQRARGPAPRPGSRGPDGRARPG